MIEKTNKLYTRSYFIKRLIEKKFYVQKVIDTFSTENQIAYQQNDSRYWTILVNPNRDNVFITCMKNDMNNYKFRFTSKNDVNTIIETESMEVIISTLINIINGPVNQNENNKTNN